jgi:hypothetical protein
MSNMENTTTDEAAAAMEVDSTAMNNEHGREVSVDEKRPNMIVLVYLSLILLAIVVVAAAAAS